MCGLAGFVDRAGALAGRETVVLEAMAASLAHRGPDEQRCQFDPVCRIGLAFRRLRVIDPSPAGSQPMASQDDRWLVVFNGEIANAPALRRELEQAGRVFRGHADTEVLVEAVAAWGVPAALHRLAGMFAAGLLDRRDRKLHLIRDRVGVKPLSWTLIPGTKIFAFASEPRALLQIPGFRRQVDTTAMASYAAHDCVTGAASVWQHVKHLLPGQRLELDLTSGAFATTIWWDAMEEAIRCTDSAARERPTEAARLDAIDRALRSSVSDNLASDVPVGVMLSGGIDSAAVLCLATQTGGAAPEAFVACFDEPELDESRLAAATAKALGARLHRIHVGTDACLNLAPRMSEINDEPFADASQVPTRALSQAMRNHVVVALSGDGGDEVFAGYHRHVFAHGPWRRWRSAPRPIRQLVAGMTRSAPADAWDALRRLLDPVLPRRVRGLPVGRRAHRWAAVIAADSEQAAYDALTLRHATARSSWWRREAAGRLPDFLTRMQLADLTGYLPDDLLTKVDRAGMSVGLEVRVPLLDHRVIEQAWRLESHMKVRDGQGKWILRRLLQGKVPEQVLGAPKRGFAVPLGRWLAGPLRSWALEEVTQARRSSWPSVERSELDDLEIRLAEGRLSDPEWTWNRLMLLQWCRHWRPSA